MKFRPLFLGLLIMTTSSLTAAADDQLLYLASTKDKSIVAYRLNDASGRLSREFRVELPGNAGPMAFSPNGKFLYAAMTGLDGGKAGVGTLKRSKNGQLKLVRTAVITSRAPYIRVDRTGRFMLAAHYGAGDVTMYRIARGICTDELLDQHKTERTAHCIEIDPSGKFVFVPHTAPNKVYQFRLDLKAGKLVPNDPPFVEGPDKEHKYHEPRHYAHHPKLDMAYTSNENGGGITSWKFDKKTGRLTRSQTLSTLSPDYDGGSAAADIQITPDGRFAYVSNRDVTKREKGEKMQDTIAGVAIDRKSGHMTLVGYFPTGHHPRATCIDLEGRYFFAAGQRSDDLYVYRINRKNGKLVHLETYRTGGVPIWVMCGEVD